MISELPLKCILKLSEEHRRLLGIGPCPASCGCLLCQAERQEEGLAEMRDLGHRIRCHDAACARCRDALSVLPVTAVVERKLRDAREREREEVARFSPAPFSALDVPEIAGLAARLCGTTVVRVLVPEGFEEVRPLPPYAVSVDDLVHVLNRVAV